MAVFTGLGSNAAPSFTFSSDTNTGIYSPGADQVAISTGGTERLRINSSGDVGIGVTNPTVKLEIAGTAKIRSAQQQQFFNSDNTAGCSIQAENTTSVPGLTFNTFGVERLRIDNAGRLLVGTSSARSNVYLDTFNYTPTVQVEQAGSAYKGLSLLSYSASGYAPILTFGLSGSNTPGTNAATPASFLLGRLNFTGNDGTNFRSGAFISARNDSASPWSSGDYPTRLEFSTTADGASSPTERMRIASNGDISFTTRGLNIEADGSGDPRIRADSNPITVLAGGSNGVKLALNAGTWTNLSDENLKTDLIPIENGLEKVKQIRTVTGRFITDDESVRRAFLIAQDFQDILPEAVVEFEPEKLGLNYTDVIPLLAAALKEAIAKIETLEAKVAALESA